MNLNAGAGEHQSHPKNAIVIMILMHYLIPLISSWWIMGIANAGL
jgi:hypothetical protein